MPYVKVDKISTIVTSLERSANLMYKWCTDKQMKGNEVKCHMLLSTDETVQVKIAAALISSCKFGKLELSKY